MKPFLSFHSFLVAILGITLSGCSTSSTNTLQLEEYPLASAPETESLSFQPLQGTQEQILAKHTNNRAAQFPNEVITYQDNPAIQSIGDNKDLLAVMTTSAQGDPKQTVKVLRGNKVIFETSAGLPSPVLPLQGLWTYNGHWALEILFTDQSTWAGEVFIDGELVNEKQGYDEAFGLQLLAGKPFFFYYRSGHAGYSYNGNETDLSYEEIPHYRCCGESTLNPIQAQNMVAFFAQKSDEWFYVELGDFNK